MIGRENTQRRRVPTRSIIAAIAMLAGIIVAGSGYFQNHHVMIYVGVVITLSGVMVEAILGPIWGAMERRRGRTRRA